MVSIIGAGPGEPDLITMKAVRRLKEADVVLYDRLIGNEILSNCKKDAELIFVGKKAGLHYVGQEQTNELMVQYAKRGLNVVRLKGGDPLIFGRGSEEAAYLSMNEIEFEIVPGITTALGAAAYSGIPLTHRNLVTKCIFITAHEEPNKEQSQIDWKEIAGLTNASIVIYMGISNIASVADTLIQFGMNPLLPVAIIRDSTLETQKTYICTLESISSCVEENSIESPAIVIISPAVDLRSEIDWFCK